LAHFLKTPLSVLAAEAEAHEKEPAAAPLAEMVKRQVFSMRRQVDHYLSRARAAGSLDVLGNRTQISAVMGDLSRVIARIHAVRGIVIDAECDDGLFFRGERQDLEEMLGNLIDNGCKWARSRVRVRCEKTGGRLILTSRTTAPAYRRSSGLRWGSGGERLDESVPGSGLGLAIVRDISKLYGGFFSLEIVPWAASRPVWSCPLFNKRNRTLTIST
jgi:signal transduction histidine kinase